MRHSIAIRRFALTTTAIGLLAGGPVAPASAANCVWNGGTGDWSSAASWSCGVVPGSGDVVQIDANAGVNSVVSVTNTQSASTLTLDSGDAINITNATLGIYGGSVVNNGTITANYYGSLIGYGASTSITGTGTIVLDNSTGPAQLYGSSANQLVLGSGQTVQGAGQIGLEQGAITNNGVINANIAGGAITLDARGGSGGNTDGSGVGTNNASGLLNTGMLEATNGGTLFFNSGIYENSGTGVIRAVGTGSTVTFGNDSSIVGGTLTSSGGGVIAENGNGTQYLTGVTLSDGSTFNIVNDNVRIGNSFTNNGTVNLSYYGSLIGNSATGNTIDGTGTIVLDSSSGPARLFGDAANKLTIGSGQTIVGSGEIGLDDGAITSNGVINANVSGRTITLDGRGGSGGNTDGSGLGTYGAGFVNNNLLEATGGGALAFNSGLYDNRTGAIQAVGMGSSVTFNNDVSIIGGTLTSSGGGAFSENGNGTQYLTDVTLTHGSTFNIVNDNVRIGNGFTNNGTVNLSYYGSLIGSSPTGNTIDGTGTIVLDSSSGPARLFGDAANKLTIGSGQTIVGSGEVGLDDGAVTSNGVINANVAGRTMTLDGRGGSGGNTDGSGLGTYGAGFVNNNLLEATGGSALAFNSGLYDNTAGTIQAVGNGSTIALNNDVSIVGGTISAGSGATIAANATGTQYLTDVTLASGSTFNITNDTVRIGDSLANNGTINVVNYAKLVGNSPTTTLTGTGTIVLDNSSGTAQLYGDGANKLTIGSGQTVVGAGQVGLDNGAITNNGIINANVSGNSIALDARGGSGGNTDGSGLGTYGAGFVNNNLLEATGGSTLAFNGGLYDNTAGTIQAVGNGSTIALNNDVSIVGGTISSGSGATIAANATGTQYLTDVTLTSGSTFNITNDTVRIGDSLANNGTINVAYYGRLIGNSPTTTLTGTGTIVLDNSSGPAQLYGDGTNRLVIDTNQTVRGSGQIGLDNGAIINRGNILADGAITIDARAGGGGNTDGTGVGTGNLAGFYNANGGQVQANNGGATLTLAGGLYENAAFGSFSAGAGSTFNMDSDSNLTNLQSGGVLNQGLYFAFAGGTMNLRSDQTASIVTIGTNHAGTDTIVTLSGVGSTIEVTPRGGGTVTTIDQSFNTIAQSGKLVIADGRSFTAQNGPVTNNGTLALSNGATFTAPSGYTNAGTTTGNGTIASPITNSGIVVADGGTLNSQAITGSTGTIQSNAGATLSLAGAAGNSTAGLLVNNGTLALGSTNITVTSDYQNANFGSGNGFNAHANVTGSGQILAVSATQDLTGPGLTLNGSGGGTLNVGNVRLGGTSSTTLTITNNGTATTLRGAVESPTTNTVNIMSGNFVVGPNGGSTTINLSYTGTTAGSLSGQSLTVANNFDNVADQTLSIQGAAYNPAAASLSPNPVNLGATRTGGTLSGTVTIANTAPNMGYSEKLAVTGTSGSGGASGTAPGGLINPGSSANSTVMLDTSTSGVKSGMVTYALATDGTGTSGLAQAALPSQSVTVNGKVYQVAVAQLGANNVTFATVRQNSTAPSATVSVTNGANGALNDSLNTSVNTLPATVTAGQAPGALAGGASGNLVFSENTATAGNFSGSGQIGFTSTDPDLAPMTLASQNIAFSGTVTMAAIAQIVKDSGAGIFSGSGTAYTLDLGTIMGGTGSLSTDLGVLNAIANFSYDETLGGMFGASGGTGYSFAGMTFSGLPGQSTNMGNLLTFNYSGLGDGTYTDTLTFNGYSHYAGLTDLTLSPIQVNVTARISGSGTTGAVPEPATWAMMLIGFGFIGGAIRRRRSDAVHPA